ncbi:hypothetical protein Cme02nite_75860 [Catellatospora methionotrophica]|uniref:Uncharacterized protein n=1 Tax=Catellatospora methionotrophica TaxID=121620 RepID=A0A8J3LPD1_9ACTN|nr:hypothetical protein [Catellatospora methionotrophica]GIG19254.1 hypothetical protein Cme02nite_75860 [Catellatospora methionotrophica]
MVDGAPAADGTPETNPVAQPDSPSHPSFVRVSLTVTVSFQLPLLVCVATGNLEPAVDLLDRVVYLLHPLIGS